MAHDNLVNNDDAIICNNDENLSYSVFDDLHSGAPARAKRAWDRAPYAWNMVNLFSLGRYVIDRAYVSVYGLYGWGRGDYLKEGRGVSGLSGQVHVFYIGHSLYGQLTAVKTG